MLLTTLEAITSPAAPIHGTFQWASDANGVASGVLDFAGFALPVDGHAIVVHLSDGTRGGCGVISPVNDAPAPGLVTMTTTTTTTSDDDSLSTGAIVGIVIAALVVGFGLGAVGVGAAYKAGANSGTPVPAGDVEAAISSA